MIPIPPSIKSSRLMSFQGSSTITRIGNGRISTITTPNVMVRPLNRSAAVPNAISRRTAPALHAMPRSYISTKTTVKQDNSCVISARLLSPPETTALIIRCLLDVLTASIPLSVRKTVNISSSTNASIPYVPTISTTLRKSTKKTFRKTMAKPRLCV